MQRFGTFSGTLLSQILILADIFLQIFVTARLTLQVLSTKFNRRKAIMLSVRLCLQHTGCDRASRDSPATAETYRYTHPYHKEISDFLYVCGADRDQ